MTNGNSTCIICKRKDSGQILWKNIKSWDVDGVYSYKICHNCGFISIYPTSSGKKNTGFYNDYSYWGVNNTKHKKTFWLKCAQREYGYIYKFLNNKKKGRILDIGAGTGLFLFKLKSDGWKVLGTEMSGLMRSYSRKMFKIKIVSTESVFRKNYESFFDLIVLNNVLEHLVDPVGYINNIWKLLKKHGMLLIITPNSKSIGYRIFKSKWYHLDPGRHLYIFNDANIGLFLKDMGFSVEWIKHGYYTHNFAGIFQSIRHIYSKSENTASKVNEKEVRNFINVIYVLKRLLIIVIKIISHLVTIVEPIIGKGEVMVINALKN